MSVYPNPFYARASEHIGDTPAFVQTFGPGVIDMLPEQIWDRLVILRSTRGAGKTSLMRAFSAESLEWVRRHHNRSRDPFFEQLQTRGVVDDQTVRKLGVLTSLDRDYRSLLDLQIPEDAKRRLFLRLLDVRVLLGVMRAALRIANRSWPEDIGRFKLVGSAGDPKAEAAVARVGGPFGRGILDYIRDTERKTLELLDALLAKDLEMPFEGHNELYCLTLLPGTIEIDGKALDMQPLLMFDDGHKLAVDQRETLLEQLARRNRAVARWYAERFEALSDQELLGDIGESGRDHVLVNIDYIARQGSSDNRKFHRGRHDRILEDIARRRAAPVLLTYAREEREFLALLPDEEDEILGDHEEDILAALEKRVVDLGNGEDRYSAWLQDASEGRGWKAAVRWRELEVLIQRDRSRQKGLFEEVLESDEADARSTPSIREGAAVSVAQDFDLPYYGGPRTMIRLASHNVEQFLHLCGDLFAEMLVDISLGRQPFLQRRRQHRVVRQASERLWESIPRTVPNGRDVQALVREVVDLARVEQAKPTMPYPPGVTGTALLMGERSQLLDSNYRSRTPGAQRLFNALASAVAHNIISADLDYSVKGNRYMVLYLNRLLCPRFWLPLGLGSFREQRLGTMVGWIQKLPSHGSVKNVQREQLVI